MRFWMIPTLVLALQTACTEYTVSKEIDVSRPTASQDSGELDTAEGSWDTASPEKDPEPEPEPVPEEVCDGIDNDGDGQIDEGFDADNDGITDCEEQTYTLNIEATGDDVWYGWLDGGSIGEFHGWNQTNQMDYTLESGHHVVAARIEDTGACIVGFMAQLKVDGNVISVTGDGSWRATASDPGGGWQELGFDSSSWNNARSCQNTTPWGEEPSSLRQSGAEWIWPYRDCESIGTGWFRFHFYLP